MDKIIETAARHVFNVRLPPDVKAWLAQMAARNGGSQNSEIIRMLRERMDRDACSSRSGDQTAGFASQA